MQELETWGAPEEMIEEAQENKEAETDLFPVHPENWPTVELFMQVQTQWRVGAMGGILGLDYVAIDVFVKYLRLEVSPDTFAGLQVMERAAVPLLNKKR